jgi:hypothetical protein
MADSGVDAAVLVPLDAHDDYVARVLTDYPKIFAAVAAPAELQTGGTCGVGSPACAAARHEPCFPISPASPPQARQHPVSSGSAGEGSGCPG